MLIEHEDFLLEIETPKKYVDNEIRNRSGHMTHAMAEFAPNCFIDFNSNCSAERFWGHNAFGWVEYRISRDGGKNFSKVFDLPISKEIFYDGIYTISVEKAVACKNGDIVAFCLRNDQSDQACFEPWATPLVVISCDEGKSWSVPYEFTSFAGRVYDAVYRDGVIYVLIFCNEHFLGEKEEDKYRIYRSCDNGRTFEELSVIPFDTLGRAYGTLLFDDESNLHAYVYNSKNELEIDHAISFNCGKDWELLKSCYVAEGARNPQTAIMDGVFILHARTADKKGLVIYTSKDGCVWDKGYRIVEKNSWVGAFYSNNIILKDERGSYLLVQYSDTYIEHDEKVDDFAEGWGKVNVMHLKIRIHKKQKILKKGEY